MAEALKEAGVYCSLCWLLDGVGSGPTLMVTKNNSEGFGKIDRNNDESILRDIAAFKQNNPSHVVTIVSDNAMLPFYKYGDYVAGIIKESEDIGKMVGNNCIIDIDGKTLVRRIMAVNKQNLCTLVGTNTSDSIPDVVIKNVKLNYAAKVIWHRTR